MNRNTSIATTERSFGDSEAGANSSTWSNTLTIPGYNIGQNVAIKIDSTGAIHLAYKVVQPGFSQLGYTFISDFTDNSTIESYIVDQTLAAGDNIDMTIFNNKPYISYFNSTFRDTNRITSYNVCYTKLLRSTIYDSIVELSVKSDINVYPN